jgi:hypothetical protein
MKQLIAIILLLTSTNVQGDSTRLTSNKWSMGIILVNQTPGFSAIQNIPFLNYFNGIILKRRFDHFSARVAIEYVNKTSKFDASLPRNLVVDEGYVNEGIIRLGVEKEFIRKLRFRSYFALDIAGMKSYGESYDIGDDNYARIINRTNGLGLIPAIGIEYDITSQLSLGLEARAKFISTKRTYDIFDYNNPWEIRGSSGSQYFRDTYEGIGAFTLNYNF